MTEDELTLTVLNENITADGCIEAFGRLGVEFDNTPILTTFLACKALNQRIMSEAITGKDRLRIMRSPEFTRLSSRCLPELRRIDPEGMAKVEALIDTVDTHRKNVTVH